MMSLPVLAVHSSTFPKIAAMPQDGWFPLSEAPIYTDANDYRVVQITAGMLADDVERVTGRRPVQQTVKKLPKGMAVVAGTLGRSPLTDQLVKQLQIDVSSIRGKWESYIVTTAQHPKTQAPLLLVIGSDRRGTAFGLTSLSEAIGVSPWYWWTDVTPARKAALYVEPGRFCQGEPSVQFRRLGPLG